MKNFLVAMTAIVALSAGAAGAADMPYKAGPMQRAGCAAFHGWYAGLHGGWTQHDTNWVDRDTWIDNFSTDWALGGVKSTTNGFGGGLQGGYNWQRGCTLIGFEVDGSWADLDVSKTYSPTAGPGTVLTLANKVEWYGTLRTRTGVIVDDMLLYVTGGLAFADINQTATITDPANPMERFSSSGTRWGGAAGVGVEWAWSERVSIKSEALYMRFSEKTTSFFSPAAAQTVHFDHQDALWVTRLGVNVKLGY